MNKLTKKEVISTIFGGFIGILFTAIYDIIKSKPILSTLWDTLKWIWKNVFEFQLAIWQVLITLAITLIVRQMILRLKGDVVYEDEIYEDEIDWLSYTKDEIHGMNWSWSWDKSYLEKWSVKDLRPLCDSCGTKMHLDESYYSRVYAECPRCERTYNEHKELRKIEAVIIDNIQRGIYLKSIG